MKIRTLLMIAIMLFIVTITLVYTIIINSNTRNRAESQFDNYLMHLSSTQNSNLEQCLSIYSKKLVNISSNYDIKAYIQGVNSNTEIADKYERANTVLRNYSSEGAGMRALAVLDSKGKVQLSTTAELDFESLSKKLESLSEGKFYCDIIPDESSPDTYYVFSKIKMSDDLFLVGIFYNTDLRAMVTDSSYQTNGRVFLIDPAGTLIDLKFMGNLKDNYMPEYLEYKVRVTDESYNLESERIYYAIGRSSRMSYLTNIGETGWRSATVSEIDGAYRYSAGAVAIMTNIAWISCVILILLEIIAVCIFFKPLYIIEDTLKSIRKGNFEARINVVSNNEYGQIANEFNELLDNVIVSEGRYRTIIEMSDNIIFEWNFLTNEVIFSQNFNKKFSYRAPSDRFEDSFLVKCKVHPDDAKRYNADLQKLGEGEVFKRKEYRWKNIYGDYIWVLVRTATISDRAGAVVKVVGVIVDIDRAKKSEKILTTRASYDSLTGLFNRETVENLINNEIELLSARKNQFAILFIDVDDFKQYNDNYSHATGDQVLKFTASAINEIVSNYGIAGRYGGDEFVVCIRNSDINDPATAAQEILEKLKTGFVCDGVDKFSINVSIGIAIIKDSSRHVDEIIGIADDAMYRIKKSGKSNYGFIT